MKLFYLVLGFVYTAVAFVMLLIAAVLLFPGKLISAVCETASEYATYFFACARGCADYLAGNIEEQQEEENEVQQEDE